MITNKHNSKAVFVAAIVVMAITTGLTACSEDNKTEVNSKSVDNSTINPTSEKAEVTQLETADSTGLSADIISKKSNTTIAVDDAEAIAIEALAMADEVNTDD